MNDVHGPAVLSGEYTRVLSLWIGEGCVGARVCMSVCVCGVGASVCVCACMHACMHVQVCVCVCMYVCRRV